MDNELLIRIGTVARGNRVTRIIDAAVVSRKTYVNTIMHVNMPNVETIVPKCCPITQNT